MGQPDRVLVVTEDPRHAQLMIDFFEGESSFHLVWVDDLQSLWQMLRANQIDLILLDYDLPDRGGLGVLSEFEINRYRLPVIMVFKKEDERFAAQAIQMGISDYVVKEGDYVAELPSKFRRVLQDHDLRHAIRQSLEKIRYQALILNNVRDAVVVWGVHGRITFWNSAAEILFGWSVAERMGDHVSVSYFPTFSPSMQWPITSIQEHEIERKAVTKSNQEIWVSSRVTELWDESEDGQLIGYMDVVRDISERKQLEAKVQGAQARLIHAARLASVGELASGIAHRINNPLTTIIADAQLLRRTLLGQHPEYESVEAIENAGWQAQKVVQSLIEFSRPTVKQREWISVNRTIKDALTLVGAQIQSNGIILHLELSDEIPKVYGDASRLQDLWVTLLLQFNNLVGPHEDQALFVRTLLNETKYVMVEFFVPGCGDWEGDLMDIFEPDFTSPKGGSGTGMELSICREIVRQHEGEIEVRLVQDSPERVGTLFQILLPTAEVINKVEKETK